MNNFIGMLGVILKFIYLTSTTPDMAVKKCIDERILATSALSNNLDSINTKLKTKLNEINYISEGCCVKHKSNEICLYFDPCLTRSIPDNLKKSNSVHLKNESNFMKAFLTYNNTRYLIPYATNGKYNTMLSDIYQYFVQFINITDGIVAVSVFEIKKNITIQNVGKPIISALYPSHITKCSYFEKITNIDRKNFQISLILSIVCLLLTGLIYITFTHHSAHEYTKKFTEAELSQLRADNITEPKSNFILKIIKKIVIKKRPQKCTSTNSNNSISIEKPPYKTQSSNTPRNSFCSRYKQDLG